MKNSLLLAGALAAAMVFSAGCASSANRSYASAHANKTVALAVTVNGAAQPTAAQWVAIKASLEPTLTARGWVLVDDIRQADQILRVDFTPSPTDPENSGRAVVLGLRSNPTAIASTGYSPTMFSYSGPFSSNYGYYGYGYNGYYGYPYYGDRYGDYSYGYAYYPTSGGGGGGGTVTPPSTTPTDHRPHRPYDPNNPPPNRSGTDPDHHRGPDGTGQYAGHRDHNPDGNRPNPPPGREWPRPPRSEDTGYRGSYSPSMSSYAGSSSSSYSAPTPAPAIANSSSFSAPPSSVGPSYDSSSSSSSFSSSSASFSSPSPISDSSSSSSSSGSSGGGGSGAQDKQN